MRALAYAGLVGLLLLAAAPARACTNFLLDTPDGPVWGCNFDFFVTDEGLVFINRRGIAKEGLGESTTGARAQWVSRYGSVTFNLVGREFAFGGMNEAGLVVGTMELAKGELPAPDERAPLPVPMWVQYLLDTCGNVQEALRVPQRIRVEDESTAQHLLIGDAEGDCAAIEWLNGDRVVHAGERLPVKAMTNMSYARALAAHERGGPSWWWSNPGRSAERFIAADERNRNYRPDRDGDAVGYAFGTLVESVGMPNTKWSIVYDIARREVWWGSVRSREVKHVALGAFDLSCDAPLLMLDVNTNLTGNVEHAFVPYDHDRNVGIFTTFCDRYGLEITPEDVREVVRRLETFRCEGAEFVPLQ